MRWVLLVALAFAAAGQAGAMVASDALGRDAAGDHVALLQQDVRQRRRSSAAAIGHWTSLANFSLLDRQKRYPVDCDAFPGLCKAPFNCHEQRNATEFAQQREAGGAAAPDFKTWCWAPRFAAFAEQCVAGNLDAAASIRGNMTVNGTYGSYQDELDASYCFIAGHCSITDVSSNTTLEEATQMCDRAYDDSWRSAGTRQFFLDTAGRTLPLAEEPWKGFSTYDVVLPFALMSCATGTYHCEVRYCQLTYCGNSYYRRRYEHLAAYYGWR